MLSSSERKYMAENPKFQIGDTIEIETHYTTSPGIKDLKAGKYIVIGFRKSAFTKVENYMIYEFKSIRKNSKYIYTFNQEWIENNSKLFLENA